ncbi:oxidoreductase [Desulfuromonas versatilis]|uniref:Oxidoreductase n=1 Tax=Desulfuromonas versatilis TaxID=2802975 RepID=A0ABN6DVL5_9BACT|nr:FAD/NAD(P)-binding protein [Desulfuromonas versatilis]BCR04153.1 oxidoreductase [Desulfuromonas versatilis]
MTLDFMPWEASLEAVDRSVPDNHLFTFRLAAPLSFTPGQFAEISVPGIGAFAVSPAFCRDTEVLIACIRRAGRVTSALYTQDIGARLGIRGPFGDGFPLDAFEGHDALLVAGGLGMAPLMSLLDALLRRRDRVGQVTLLYGSRDPSGILFRRELGEIAASGEARVLFTVDFAAELPWEEGAFVCRVGLVNELFSEVSLVAENTTAAVCGPPAMYGCVLEQLAGMGIPAQRIFATLERRMKCGIGQCCHCVTAGTFICREGPVFSLARLRAMPGAI